MEHNIVSLTNAVDNCMFSTTRSVVTETWSCRSMVALLVSTPEVAGAAFTSELYSPHLDVHQRMLILETLASAAQQMANPRARLQAGKSQGTGLAGALEAGGEARVDAMPGMTTCRNGELEESLALKAQGYLQYAQQMWSSAILTM